MSTSPREGFPPLSVLGDYLVLRTTSKKPVYIHRERIDCFFPGKADGSDGEMGTFIILNGLQIFVYTPYELLAEKLKDGARHG